MIRQIGCQALSHAGRSNPSDNATADLDVSSLNAVREHYRDTIPDYRLWSPEGNLHFGYWRWGINPLRRSSMLAEMNRQVILHLKLDEASEGNVADLGCGLGATSRYGARYCSHIHWHAVNIAPAQLEIAETTYDGSNISFHCGDYHQLPWSTSSFDGAFFVESLCYSLRPHDALREVARILKPGSRLVVTDGFLRRPLTQSSLLFQRLFKEVANNWAVPAYHEHQRINHWAEQAGLRVVLCREIGWNIAASVFHSLPLTLWCALRLRRGGVVDAWRWRQLRASSLALALGLHRRSFGYYLVILEKSRNQRTPHS